MALKLAANKAKTTGGTGTGKKRELVPAGQFPARLVRITDLGLHPKIDYKTGKVTGEQYKVRFTYELLTSFLKDEDGNDMKDKPRWISENIPITKALAFADAPAQPWYGNCGIVKRYRAISGNPLAAAEDLSVLLGEACSVLVVHEADRKGKTDDEGNVVVYANVGEVAADPFAMMGQEAPALVNEAKFLDLSEPSLELYEEEPNFVKEMIVTNLEFAGSPLEKLMAGEEAGGDEPEAADPYTPESVGEDAEEEDADNDGAW
ncbi:hypothetical protein NVP1293O_39 [Vibrio phage 1.293.O._10N.261.52.E1]|nr:hypothetical protein NVP1293O_39 [Vibrio phage 1.293.O._10N.261.52.E1]